ncbi:hypothetical protein T439DRAFT_380615 [Meredithblackwellia eburnea MCA 4105]
MKIVSTPTSSSCRCSVCSRRRQLEQTADTAANDDNDVRQSCACSICNRTKQHHNIKNISKLSSSQYQSRQAELAASPAPGPSSVPLPALSPAQRAPNEILQLIFELARPSPTASTSAWKSYRSLSLVCERWCSSSQRALGHHINLRSALQVPRLATALTSTHTLTKSDIPLVDGKRVKSITHNMRVTSEESANFQSWIDVLSSCSERLESVALKGFGDVSWSSWPSAFSHVRLHSLKKFDYSPVDHSSLASTQAISGWLYDQPSITSLELSSRLQPLTLMPFSICSPPAPFPRAQLTSLSLQSIQIDAATLVFLAGASLHTLQSLHLREVHFLSHVATPHVLIEFFNCIGPNLHTLVWESKLYSTWVPSSADELFSLLTLCTTLRKLSLFNNYVFDTRPEGFRLPVTLEELVVGRKGTIRAEWVWSWFDLATIPAPPSLEGDADSAQNLTTDTSVQTSALRVAPPSPPRPGQQAIQNTFTYQVPFPPSATTSSSTSPPASSSPSPSPDDGASPADRPTPSSSSSSPLQPTDTPPIALPSSPTQIARGRSSHRRGRRDRERERTREKGKQRVSPSSQASSPSTSSTPSPSSSPMTPSTPTLTIPEIERPPTPPPPPPPPPTLLSSLAIATDQEKWPFTDELKLYRAGVERGVEISFHRLRIVQVDVLEQTVELRSSC